jgi:TonB family protein
VSDTAEIEVITAAYRALMRKYHPDINASPSSGEKAKEINEAYEVLCDAGKRRNYDQQRQTSKGGQSQEQERARQERERERKEQAGRQNRERDAQARERQGQERKEREAHAKKSASSETKSSNQTANNKSFKALGGSPIIIYGALAIGTIFIIGFFSTKKSSSDLYSTEITADINDRQVVDAFARRDFSYLRDLANKGRPNAQFYLGLAYENGDGVTEDDVVAVGWYRRAAEQGNVKAQYNLGLMHATGKGVPQHYAAAVEWFRKAAEQGDVRAQYRLGLAYSTGTGVDRDYVQAHKWLNLAAAGAKEVDFRDKAIKSRDMLTANMSPVGIAEAQRLAGSWRAMQIKVPLPKSPHTASSAPNVPAKALRPEPFRAAAPKPEPFRGAAAPKPERAVPLVAGLSADNYHAATPRGTDNRFYDYDYPSDSSAANEDGIVVVTYIVGTDGYVSQCEVKRSSSFQRLDDATCSIVQRRFRFNPATRNGQPVPERKTQPVRWKLHG